MRAETVAILNMADAIPGYGREELLKDLQYLLPEKQFYSCEELAKRYGVTGQTLKNWEKDLLLIPDLRVGKGCVRYSAAIVAAFEKQNPEKRI